MFFFAGNILIGLYVSYRPKQDKSQLIFTCGLLNSIAILFTGPSVLFSMPNALLIVIIGYTLVGISFAFMTAPLPLYMLELCQWSFGSDSTYVNDVS